MNIEANVDYGENPYGITIEHNHLNVYEQSFYSRLKILDRLYWINSRLSNKDFRKLSIDLHIDR